ncbi:MAG: hypothetical protein KAW41_03065 [Candidatus Diapherotrites archaeon]|nr:hypothetical protein [Candidatus Diapherotrites archaeon]
MIMLAACFITAFLATYLATPKLIKKAHKYGFVGRDMHKKGKPKVAEMGGLSIVFGFCLGAFLFAATSMFSGGADLVPLFAAVCSVLLICIVGIVDDLFRIRWRTKIFLPLIAAVPLMAVRAGSTIVTLPAVGAVDLGAVYILLLIPLGVTGAANAVNMVGGYNGMEAGLGSLIIFSLLLVALNTGSATAAILLVSMLGALLAFLKYNRHPSKVFPGDTGTLQIGALIASAVIIGNMEKAGFMMFALYFINLVLMLARMATGTKKKKFSGMAKDGRLTAPHPFNIHYLAIKLLGKPTEKSLVLWLLLAQAAVCTLVLVVV